MDYKKKMLRDEYCSRINRVMNFIQENLGRELFLDELATVANFSPYHFHRIFKGMVGETIGNYIKRLRLERAATMLAANPKKDITQIAYDCGFSSSAAFARAFKEKFAMTASEFRKGCYEEYRKICKEKGKDWKDIVGSISYFPVESQHKQWRNFMSDLEMKVEVKEMPEFNVIYIRHIGPYNQIGPVYERLGMWAGARGLWKPDSTVLAVYYDNPDITDEDKLRCDACIVAPEGTEVEGEVGTQVIPGGLFAVARVEIRPDQFGEAWDKLMGEWFPESGYEPDDRLCYEIYINDPQNHPEGKFVLDICEPVRPL